jgi:putative protease
VNKPEILAPAGNPEAFYAALEAGADAVYLGIDRFNARERASNFDYTELPVLIEEAHKNDCKLFLTLNTVIKNSELSELIDILAFLNRAKPDAVIIQDWGVYYLVKTYFPKLVLHASTQMAIHNSNGAVYVQKKGFERFIPARELTMDELRRMIEKSNIDVEVFVHGALCYSFSGMCHFSSYLGGHGANRGLCAQVCRRTFDTPSGEANLFNLKDNMQAAQVAELMDMEVESFKIEGRLKSDEYVYRVTKAYRDLVDGTISAEQAEEILKTDGGREKTGYFLASNLKNAVSEHTNSGLYLGAVSNVSDKGFSFNSKQTFDNLFRLRIQSKITGETQNIKVRDFEQADGIITVNHPTDCNAGDALYLLGEQVKKFPQKLPEYSQKIPKLKAWNKGKILKELRSESGKIPFALFVRIDNPDWLKKIYFNSVDAVVFSFTEDDWNELRLNSGLIQNYRKKIWIELPHFMSEKKLEFYKTFVSLLVQKGFTRFMLSHISQKEILPEQAIFAMNENAYAYNDAAVKHYRSEGAKLISYPIENDSENLNAFSYKAGIVPLYFFPRLFISRMPVKQPQNEIFKDDTGKEFRKVVREGQTIVVPEKPTAFFQYVKDLKKTGFGRFMIDLSFEKPSSNRFNTLLKRYFSSEQIQPSDNFNFKRGLK